MSHYQKLVNFNRKKTRKLSLFPVTIVHIFKSDLCQPE